MFYSFRAWIILDDSPDPSQVFAPFSPHNFVDSFPNISPEDCPERPAAGEVQAGCRGDADQYGNYRAPRIVSLKHHWFWLMNHVWDEMEELRGFQGHVMFMEEDHVVAPNAYRTLQVWHFCSGQSHSFGSSGCLEADRID
jgi:alpha-1,6-mannosyl-glycoprotein beta-1,2-N-acetylglucosaminyltransferase